MQIQIQLPCRPAQHKAAESFQQKVPQLIDPDKIVRLGLPGERLEGIRSQGNVLLLSTVSGEGASTKHFFVFPTPIEHPIAWQDGEGVRIIASRAAAP